MRITALDIRKQEFRRGMRGLDPEEVYAFLSTVADEYESALNDNKALRERLLELDDKVQEYRSMEKTLRDTLLTAERVNVEAKDNARREANIIIKEAQIEAEKALRDIKTEAMKLRQQVQNLHSQRDAYLARMKVVAESHLGTIASAIRDFQREDAALDDDVTEERLADQPAEHEEAGVPRRPSNLFDGPKPAAPASPAPVEPPAPRSPEPPRESAPPPPAANPETPSSLAAPPSPEAVTPRPISPRSPASGLSTGSADPISVIIDRMKKGQLETLASGAGTPGLAVDVEKDAAPELDSAAPSRTAVAPDEKSDRGDVDVTSEFNLDEIRRELAAEEKSQR